METELVLQCISITTVLNLLFILRRGDSVGRGLINVALLLSKATPQKGSLVRIQMYNDN